MGKGGPSRLRGAGLVVLLMCLALILAIGFFYLTEGRQDREADAVTEAAAAIDKGADSLSAAARNAARRLDPD